MRENEGFPADKLKRKGIAAEADSYPRFSLGIAVNTVMTVTTVEYYWRKIPKIREFFCDSVLTRRCRYFYYVVNFFQ